MQPVFNKSIFLLLAFPALTIAQESRDAETIFDDFCFSCHGTGWENAPVIGDSFAWEERKEQGIDVLLKHTLEGFNTMPAKGSCTDCSEEELRKVVEWMIED